MTKANGDRVGTIIADAKRKRAKRTRLYKDRRYQQVIGFLVGKGYLSGDVVPSKSMEVINLKDVLWVAAELEPRVIEVLPAALLHFPKAFKGYDDLPEEFLRILRAIKRGEILNDQYLGIRFKDMKRWTNIAPRDGRVKPLEARRKMRSFRLAPDTLRRLRELATTQKVSETELIERLINEAKA